MLLIHIIVTAVLENHQCHQRRTPNWRHYSGHRSKITWCSAGLLHIISDGCAHCWAQRARTFHQSYIFYSAFLNRLCLYICSICKLLICYIKPVQYHVLSWIQLSGGCGGRWSCFMALGNQMDTYNMLSYLYWMRQMVFTDSFEPGEGYIPGGGHTFDIPTCEYPGGLWLWYISS